MAGLGRGVGGAEVGEFIGGGEEGADGGLLAPDDELAEGELVLGGDVEEGAVGLKEVAEDGVGVEGDGVDLGVEGLGEGGVGGGGEHVVNVTRGGAGSRARFADLCGAVTERCHSSGLGWPVLCVSL